MGSVRTVIRHGMRVFDRDSCLTRHAAPDPWGPLLSEWSPSVLDLVFVLGVITLFVILGVLGKAVEKL